MSSKINKINQTPEIHKPKPAELKAKPKPLETVSATEREKKIFLQHNNMGANALKMRLFNKLDSFAVISARQTPTVDAGKVEDAVKSIKDSLHQGITDWDVTHGDLKDIQNTFKNLTAEEANQVFENLSNDDLKNWTQELNGLNGSFSREEKQTLFDDLAGKLNAQNLAALSEHLGLGSETDNIRPGQKAQPDINILADSIARNAPDNVKAEFVKIMADKAEKHQDVGTAAAQVLASMKDKPELLKQTLSELSDSQLQAIVDGAARKTEVSTRGGKVINYDPEPLAELLNAVSTLQGEGAATQKARLFEMSASKITQIRDEANAGGVVPFGVGSSLYYGQPAEDLIRNGLTKLLDSDTVGVVRELEQNENSHTGKGITAYIKSMINAGDKDNLALFVNRLMTGNDLTGKRI